MLSGKLPRIVCVLLLCIFVFLPAGSSVGSSSQFYSYAQLTNKLQSLSTQYPDLVKLSVEGKSVENKNIWSVTVGKGSKKILVTGSLHGSEWITTAVLVETIETYLKEYSQGKTINGQSMQYILDSYSITFFPMVNPDGVTLVQEGAGAFPHLKNDLIAMNPHGENFSRWKANIRGVDLNRNYNIRWGLPIDGQVSDEPSYAFYPGPSPESEPETKVIANWVRKHKPVMLLDYHSYGEILYWYYLQTGSILSRDRAIVQALRSYTGYRMEAVRPSTRPSSTLTYWGSSVAKIPSICVEVGHKSPYLLRMSDLPRIIGQVRYLPLIAIINSPGYKAYYPVRSVSLPKSVEILKEETIVLKASFSPSNATDKKVTWTSSHPEIVSVDPKGVVTALDIGSAKISVVTADGGKVATSQVTVSPNRFINAVEISKATWDESDYVVLTHVDAEGIAELSLANQLTAPVLLSNNDDITSFTKDELLRLQAKKVYILGEETLSDKVDKQLESLGLEVVRIQGYTDADSVKEISSLLAPSNTAVIIYGFDFPDALSVASYASDSGFPIVHTNQSDLNAIIKNVLNELDVRNTAIIGGTAVFRDTVLNLPNATRIDGPDINGISVQATPSNQGNSVIFISTSDGFGILLMANQQNDSPLLNEPIELKGSGNLP